MNKIVEAISQYDQRNRGLESKIFHKLNNNVEQLVTKHLGKQSVQIASDQGGETTHHQIEIKTHKAKQEPRYLTERSTPRK